MVYEMLRICSQVALTNGYSVIADATFTKRRDRQVFAKLAHKAGSNFLSAKLHCSLRLAMLRNSQRSGSKFVPKEKLISMHNSYEDDAFSLVLDTGSLKPEAIAHLLLQRLGFESPESSLGSVSG
jgi:predicted kinase